MKHRQIVFFALAALVSYLPGFSIAQEENNNPAVLIEQSTDRVLQVLESHTETGEAVSVSALADELLSTLEAVVDFESIARGVMGKHAGAASDKQVQEFASVFRESLVSLYARSFRTFEIKEARVLDMPVDFDAETAAKATVRMQATTADGESYSLSYAMRRDDERRWVVRNIVVDGINLGLTYMNQFDGAMSRYGSVDTVIARWPEEMREQTVVGEE
ncbi:MlaC/ttg2D family ABC transporter substrate-binding protein [Chromatocurvus halotolerans]|uniref:Phospholipid transport system substrate-binding protein n=1 Tax=Chromatocurvus halotolerans TaxID=1132028 RepID=A0A4V2SC33_9GAMM|nr:ABC transporter substrate-binding protein [Chromatocurvus halotolerans]TCO77870.1 phospholipid transport system substrate-binding protein [Chromatocurvus halotolerans]